MRILLSFIVLLLTAAPSSAKSGEETLMILASAADLISTEVALHQGLTEGNPLLHNRTVRIGLKAASTAFAILASRELDNSGHERLAKIIRRASIAVGFGAASWNIGATIAWGGK